MAAGVPGRQEASDQKVDVKKNLQPFVPWIGVGVLVLFGGGLGWVIFSGWDQARLTASELSQRRQNSVLVLPGGVGKIQQDTAQLINARSQLEKDLRILAQPGEEAWGSGQPWATDPGQWKDRLIEVNDRFRKESGPAGQNSKVILPNEFYLGFEEYRQKSPPPDQVPSLARQLSVAQRLLDHLLASRKEAIEPFPTPCILKSLKLPGTPSEVASANAVPIPVGKPLPPSKKSALRETYQMAFECSPEVLRELIWRITKDSWIFIPIQLKVENEQVSFPKRAEFEKKFAEPPGVPPGTGDDKILLAKAPLLLVLAGKEKLKIFLEVDFVGWPPSPESAPPPKSKREEGS